jgi:hypothetical protein
MEPELKEINYQPKVGFLQLLIFYITRYIHEGWSMAIISSGSRFVETQQYRFEMLLGNPVPAKHIPNAIALLQFTIFTLIHLVGLPLLQIETD